MARLRSKQGDPISERARTLSAEIAALEAQIRDLGAELESAPRSPVSSPKSHRYPSSGRPTLTKEATGPDTSPPNHEVTDAPPKRSRKSVLAQPFRRLKRRSRKPASADPRLINYLAAGSIQGLRPLRYEKRVARNRVMALSLLLIFVIWGLIAVLQR